MKYKWKVNPVPTGRYSSFEHRGFPEAIYEDGSIAASMVSESEYSPKDVKTGNYKPIKLRIADYSITPWKWRVMKGEFKTIQEAKDAFEIVIMKYPHIVPIKKSDVPEFLK